MGNNKEIIYIYKRLKKKRKQQVMKINKQIKTKNILE